MRIRKVVKKVVRDDCLVELTCDMCGKSSGNYQDSDGNVRAADDWSLVFKDSGYGFADTMIKGEFGNNWPEGGTRQCYEIDLCPTCFLNELIPFLKSKGTRTEATAVDY